MRFKVTRTPHWDDEQPPCPEAEHGQYESRTYYRYKTLAEAERWNKANRSERPYELDHNGKVCSPARLSDGWFVTFDTIHELAAFYERHGSLIITSAYDNYELVELEIYDGYRE